MFAVVAVFVGTIGVCAILAFGVAQRRGEFAIRLALGAERGSIVGDVIRRALGLAGVGIVLALLATRLLDGALSALLAGADPHDARAFVAAGMLMLFVVFVAATGPAIRSVGLDLVTELRSS